MNWPTSTLVAPKTQRSELQRLPTTQNKCLTLSKKENNFLALLINSMCSCKQDGQLSGTLSQSRANIVTSVRMLGDTKDEKMEFEMKKILNVRSNICLH